MRLRTVVKWRVTHQSYTPFDDVSSCLCLCVLFGFLENERRCLPLKLQRPNFLLCDNNRIVAEITFLLVLNCINEFIR